MVPTENKLREIKHLVEPWLKPNSLSRKEVKLNRLRIDHTKVSHGFLTVKAKPPICFSFNKSITIEHIIIHCLIYTEVKKEFQIPDNLYEV